MKIIYLIILLFSIMSCHQKINIKNSTVDESEIIAAMKTQEAAWNRGDLTSFMEAYWKSDKLKFVGSHGINYGWQTTLENYQKSYPNTKVMGKLHFDIDLIERLGNDTYYLIGRYTLIRDKDEPSGYFNLIWRKIGVKWKIVTDMTCG